MRSNPKLSIFEASKLLDVPERTLRYQCNTGILHAIRDKKRSWLIPLSSLPPIAQARYWIGNASDSECFVNVDNLRKLSEEEEKDLWSFYEESSEKLKQKAIRDAEACLAWQIMKSEGKNFQDLLIEIEQEYGIKSTAIYDKLKAVKDYEPRNWPALLVGKCRGENAKRVEWHPDAWLCFIREATTPGRKIKTAWEYTKRQAEKNGWGKIPSYDTAKSHYKKLPHDVITLLKDGEAALKVKSPTLIRKYDLPLHDTWSLDGRRFDLLVIDLEGKYGEKNRIFRPWVYAFEEVRTRVFLGYAIGVELDSDLVRDAFLDALKTTDRIIPRRAQPDNGMESAAKEITGGAPWRRRGKVKDDEIIGLFSLFDILVEWTTVAHGQSKPIERLFGTVAQRFETRYDFKGAFCANSPGKRPEECSKDKAIPLDLFEQVLKEESDAYNRSPHSGDGMEGRSPLHVYDELINQPGYVARKISKEQLRICAYSAVAITIRKNATFTIFGASYWSEGTAKLPPGKGYYARFNPRDLSDTVYVYKGKKLMCEATKKELTSFNDKAAGKRISKDRAAYKKKVKALTNALLKLKNTESQEFLKKLAEENSPENVEQKLVEALPKPKVIGMVKNNIDMPEQKTAEELEHEEIKKEAEKIRKEQSKGVADSYRKRAITKRKGA